MRHPVHVVLLAVLLAAASFVAPRQLLSQASDRAPGDRIYWGGGISVAFWDYTRIRVEPLVGYRITRTLSAGVKLSGEYLRYERFAKLYDPWP